MILEGLAQWLAGLACPDCGTAQPIYTKAGFKSRIRVPHHAEACPNCGATLHMVYAEGGPFREGLGWGGAAVVLFAVAILLTGIEIALPTPLLIASVIAAMALLYAFAIAMTGLILGWTRRMIKP
ncbi:hypothetical protein [Pseudooceanicola sp.]|uniref:hypothetical protein n=1 Tax=Pseudooceanicola sp. TaxID=1914328 RepID=UPI002622CD3D|nr:hypothetical protein [Pseudooceanicola sp.]MDF1855675.1 hypothetical protein [Pseudooceanicola sp.]